MLAPLYLCALLAGTFVTMRSLPTMYAHVVLLICGLISFWYILLFYGIGQGTEILTPFRVIIVLSGLIVIAGLACIHLFYATSVVWIWARRALFPALGVLVLGLSFLDPTSATQNIHSLSTNATSTFWSFTWYLQFALLGVMLMSLALGQGRASASPVVNIWVFHLFLGTAMFALVFAFGFVRIPYRLGWGDSGNRIATIILPILLCASLSWCVVLSQRDPLARTRSSRKGLPLLFGVLCTATIVLALLPIVTRLLPSLNQATYARVIEADSFYPGYEFEQALDNSCKRDSTYTASFGGGPRTIVLELAHRPDISKVSLCFYPKQHFTDFALLFSQDGDVWTKFYDAQSIARQRPIVYGNIWVLDDLDIEDMQFFKLEYRASEGRDRMLLRGLSLLK